MAHHRTTTEMYPIIKRWERSNKRKQTFCEEEGINLHTFIYWLKKYRRSIKNSEKEETSSDFIELRLENSPIASSPISPFAEIKYPNGISLHLYQPMSSSDLGRLIQSFR